MAKPPKKIAATTAADTTVTPRAAQPGAGNRASISLPDIPLSGVDPATGSLSTANIPPAVITVSTMPGPIAHSVSAPRHAVAWPDSRLSELIPIGENSGLFTGPDQRTYAQLGSEGRFLVEQDALGSYYMPMTFAPGVAGPSLTKVEGHASFHIQRPDWSSTPTRTTATDTPLPTYLSPEDANTLTRADMSSAGLRYNKLKQAFVDTAEGTVMVRKNPQGEYRHVSATTRSGPDIVFEQIPDSLLWRRKTTQAQVGISTGVLRRIAEPTVESNKRVRLDAGEQTVTTPPLAASTPNDQTPFFWLPWGHLNKPPVVESIQLGWLHYPIVPVGSNHTPKVYFVQHPDFVPARFEAFEQMLRTAPSLQPVATFRIGNDPGEIHPGKRFFEEPISQSVANTFADFSAATAWAVGKRLFELADNSAVITGTGLVNIQAVLHQWKQKPFPSAPAYADPLNMLAIAPSIDARGKKLIPMPSQSDSELQRLTFDPKRFPIEWNHYKTWPTDLNLRRLLGALLIRCGYDVFPLTYEHRQPTLVFKRDGHDPVYFLKLGSVAQVGLSHRPGNELADPSLPSRIGSEAFRELTTAATQGKVIWLIGGVLKVESNPDSVFIIRER